MANARRTIALLGVTAAMLGGLTACKSSGGGKAGTSAVKQGAAVHLLVDTVITGGPATGGIAFPGGANGAKAAAAALNKTGGINGHKVIIDVCDNKADPNGGATCARTAKSSGALAVAGGFDIAGSPKALPILQQAGIPYVGGLPGNPAELSNPISFQFDGGVNGGGFGTIAQMKDLGCKNVADFSPGGPSAALDPLLKAQYLKAGFKFKIVVATAGTADMTPFVSQALAVKPDCVVAEGPGQDTAKIISVLRKQGSKVKIFTSVGSLVPQVLASLGTRADGVYADNTTLLADSDDPLVAKFRADMIAFLGQNAAEQNFNEFAQDGYSSVMVINDALKGAKDVSSKTLLAALNKMSSVTAQGVKAPLDFTKTRNSKIFPRLFNTWVRFFIIKGGKYTELDGQWHDANQYIP